MGPISVVLLIAFIIICVLSVLLVLVQDQENSGMGGMLGGGNSVAFGSHSASVLTKVTIVFVVLFFVSAFMLAFLNKKSSVKNDISAAAVENGLAPDTVVPAESGDWWKKSQTTEPAEPAVIAEPENLNAETEASDVSE
jgi:preprotein translocase subunit SecG